MLTRMLGIQPTPGVSCRKDQSDVTQAVASLAEPERTVTTAAVACRLGWRYARTHAALSGAAQTGALLPHPDGRWSAPQETPMLTPRQPT